MLEFKLLKGLGLKGYLKELSKEKRKSRHLIAESTLRIPIADRIDANTLRIRRNNGLCGV